ncbi:prolyl oligopeptidase family serine peptidase [Ilumatobacter sp.]|uniref:S9 family peptidase n=1 Tax=Ilumatobacter sp. TaxID=1967498 RepID=UPI003B519A71
MSDTFPRQSARTQRFTLGAPRDVTVSPNGRRVVFLRSTAGDDPVNSLWVLDVATGRERLVADPRTLLGGADPTDGDIDDAERARRERARDGTSGIGSYATDRSCEVVAFALDGRLFTAGLLSGRARALPVDGPVFDPRPDPTASRLAYVSGRRLVLGELDGTTRVLAGDDPKERDTVSWGGADFVAAEEMGRDRGFWWSPDGRSIVACRVDEGPVESWTISDPARPAEAARTVRYPAAGTDNAIVTLHLFDLDGTRREIDWDRGFFPYLASVDWSDEGLLISVQSRDQRGSMAMRVDLGACEAVPLASDYDDAWIENVPGVPRLLAGGRLLTASDRDGVRRLHVDDDAVTSMDLQVRSVIAAAPDDRGASTRITFRANDLDRPTEVHVWTVDVGDGADGAVRGGAAGPDVDAPRRWTEEPGVHTAEVGGSTTVIRSVVLDEPGATFRVLVDSDEVARIATHAEAPSFSPNISFSRSGPRDLATAVLLPTGRDPGDDGLLPVLVDPYGGPHAQRVVASHDAHLSSQWFADQGFAVVVADGRGTPGRGAEFERAVRGDLAGPPLDDQIDVLEAVAERTGVLDLDRVAIRGWSFGGYLAALAVLRRPDVFHAAIAGAPVTEWRLYDTHYTERYLGDPFAEGGAAAYDASSLLPLAADLVRPLLLIHGLADDNVVAAHTLQLSSALLAAGRPHEVLPLVGVSHMTPQEVVAENLLRHQLDFLARALGLDLGTSSATTSGSHPVAGRRRP